MQWPRTKYNKDKWQMEREGMLARLNQQANSLRRFTESVKGAPKLTPLQERRILDSAIDHDQRAEEMLFQAYRPLAASIAENYRSRLDIMTPLEISFAAEAGLLMAIRRLGTATEGAKISRKSFKQYADWRIRQIVLSSYRSRLKETGIDPFPDRSRT